MRAVEIAVGTTPFGESCMGETSRGRGLQVGRCAGSRRPTAPHRPSSQRFFFGGCRVSSTSNAVTNGKSYSERRELSGAVGAVGARRTDGAESITPEGCRSPLRSHSIKHRIHTEFVGRIGDARRFAGGSRKACLVLLTLEHGNDVS